MKKLIVALTLAAAIAAGMYGEFRYIMTHINPYIGENAVYVEFMGSVDEYDMITACDMVD